MKKFYCLSLLCLFFLGRVVAQSDNCATATPLTPSASCAPVNGTTTGATASIYSGCVGNADDDVWYQFTATATSHVITVTPVAGMDPVLQLFSGGCNSLVTLSCQDVGFSGQHHNGNVRGAYIRLQEIGQCHSVLARNDYISDDQVGHHIKGLL